MKQLEHYIQLYNSGRFQQFNFGEDYDLSNVTAPVYLYHAEVDKLVVQEDVDNFAKKLPNLRNYEIIDDFNHLDLMMGKDAREMVYEKIVHFMESDE
jgi:poly(3-hydroxyalkanoate) synthetase